MDGSIANYGSACLSPGLKLLYRRRQHRKSKVKSGPDLASGPVAHSPYHQRPLPTLDAIIRHHLHLRRKNLYRPLLILAWRPSLEKMHIVIGTGNSGSGGFAALPLRSGGNFRRPLRRAAVPAEQMACLQPCPQQCPCHGSVTAADNSKPDAGAIFRTGVDDCA